MNWEAKIITHRGIKRIAVYFEKNAELIARIKKLEGSRWSQSLGVWHLPDTEENRIRFKLMPMPTLFLRQKAWLKSQNSNNTWVPNAIAKIR